jgi:type IV secretory pathway VirB2 component (pilin)
MLSGQGAFATNSPSVDDLVSGAGITILPTSSTSSMSMITPTSTSSSTPSATNAVVSSATNAVVSSATNAVVSSAKSQVGAIVGGTVGGAMAIIGIIVLGWLFLGWLFLQRRKKIPLTPESFRYNHTPGRGAT